MEASDRMEARTSPKRRYLTVLRRYFWLTYAALLINASRYLPELHHAGWLVWTFAAAIYLTSFGLLMLPVQVLARLLGYLLFWRRLDGLFGARRFLRAAPGYLLAIVGFSAIQVYVQADLFIYHHWLRHIDLFVWNLLTTPGGYESMDIGRSAVITFSAIIAGLAAVQVLLLVAAAKIPAPRGFLKRVLSRKAHWAALATLGAILAFQAVTYGVCKLRWYLPVLRAAQVFPVYVPLTFTKLGRAMGLEANRRDVLSMRMGRGDLSYPLEPIDRDKLAKRYNIVWLTVESWRADMVDPQIMPQTHAFARENLWFRHHYSGGHDTRMGMFSMFYGLYGSYWFTMLDAHRSPVLMDLLQDDGYEFSLYSSQGFTYPEFDRTIFVHVPQDRLHPYTHGRASDRDRLNTDKLLEFLDRRDRSHPFMTFLFFETPHAKYDFNPPNEIRKPFLKDFNYATMSAADAPLIKNRYINSCNCLDGQLGRIFQGLRQRNLLDSTLVVITGDHGEEFMEKGRWGHASETFHQEQELVPLVLHAPGHKPQEVTRMTSHLDIAPTVMALLGVKNPPQDYCLGFDLLGQEKREFTVIASWSHMAYVDGQYKIIFPFKGEGLHEVVTADDASVSDDVADGVLRSRLAQRVQLLKDMRKFKR